MKGEQSLSTELAYGDHACSLVVSAVLGLPVGAAQATGYIVAMAVAKKPETEFLREPEPSQRVIQMFPHDHLDRVLPEEAAHGEPAVVGGSPSSSASNEADASRHQSGSKSVEGKHGDRRIQAPIVGRVHAVGDNRSTSGQQICDMPANERLGCHPEPLGEDGEWITHLETSIMPPTTGSLHLA